MTGQLIAYARQVAETLRADGIAATTKASAAVPPCVLVVPIPARTYDTSEDYLASWEVVCLAPAPADEKAAEQLEHLVDVVAKHLPVETARPVAYKLPTSADPVPAVVCTFTTEVDAS